MTAAVPCSPGTEHRESTDPARIVNSRATTLRALHRPGDPLLLANVWDANSARLVVTAGLPAVATSSAAIADSLGYGDGEQVPVGEMFHAVARIVDAVDVPVTADLERGYGMAPAELVERLVATGAAGCNLEDSDPRTGTLIDAERQAGHLSAVREAAQRCGVDIVINARIDTYVTAAGNPAEQLAETIRRARLYRAAGADCLYPILLAEEPAIADLVDAAGAPVNILAGRQAPAPTALAKLNVARISYGPSLYRSTQAHLAGLIAALVNPDQRRSG